jgi:hypothetical protein
LALTRISRDTRFLRWRGWRSNADPQRNCTSACAKFYTVSNSNAQPDTISKSDHALRTIIPIRGVSSR